MNEEAHEEAVVNKHTEDAEQELRQIYQDETGEMPDLSTLEAPKRSWRKTGLWTAGILLLLTAGIWLGFFVFGTISFSGSSDYLNLDVIARPISVDTDRSEPLVSGTPSRIAVHYQNIARAPLASLSLRLNLPDSLVVDRFVPEPTDTGNVWQLGNIAPKSDGLIEIYGTLIGTVPSTEKLQMIASYRPANFSSEFDEIVVKDLVIETSALELQVTSPDKATPGEEVTLDYELLNPSRDAVQNLELHPVLPEGFRLAQSEPPIEEGFRWTLPRLEAHSKTGFSLTGTFSADTRGLYDVGGDVFLRHGNEHYLQTQTLRPMDIFGGALSTSVIVNGSSRDQSIDPGSTLRISIPIENASEINVNDLSLELDVEADGPVPIEWTGLSATYDGGERSGDSIRWEADTIERLEQLRSGEEVVFDLILPLRETLSENLADRMTLTAHIEATPTTNTSSRIKVSTTPLTISLNSNTSLYTSAVYHDTSGNPIGSGPLPPTVGETTTYAIIWSIDNAGHALENVVLETQLPPHVRFVPDTQVSAGELLYRDIRGAVRWEIERIEESASARFNVSVTPKEGDAGTFLKLIDGTELSARDAETGSRVVRTGSTLTTQLRDDAFATDDGVVTE